MGATPTMNRSAKDGERSSPHYGGEGVTHSPIEPRCLLTARYGRLMLTPGDLHRSRPAKPGKQPYKRKRSQETVRSSGARRSEAEGPLSGGQSLLTQELEACVGARSRQSGCRRHGWGDDWRI